MGQFNRRVTYDRVTADDVAALLSETDVAHGDLPAAGATGHLGVEGPRDDLVPEAYPDQGYAGFFVRCMDKIDQPENPLVVGEGIVLFESRVLVPMRKFMLCIW